MILIKTYTVVQATAYIFCGGLNYIYGDNIRAMGEGGGSVTAPLLFMHDVASIVLIILVVPLFKYRKAVSILALIACPFCLLFLLYYLTPYTFEWMFSGDYKVAAFARGQHCSREGLCAVTIATVACLSVASLILRPDGVRQTN